MKQDEGSGFAQDGVVTVFMLLFQALECRKVLVGLFEERPEKAFDHRIHQFSGSPIKYTNSEIGNLPEFIRIGDDGTGNLSPVGGGRRVPGGFEDLIQFFLRNAFTA